MKQPVAGLYAEDVQVTYGARGLLSRRRQGNMAVRGASLVAPAGEVTGVVGESGSGKSSLGLGLAGLNRAMTAGDVTLRDLNGDAVSHGRLDIQMVFQDPIATLDPRQSVGAGLKELARLHRHRVRDGDIEKTLDTVNLDSRYISRYPHQLSGGQCQRACIARALLVNPKCIIADEPTSSLDVSVQAHILTLLRKLCIDTHISVILITHDIAVVRQVCDTLYVMNAGDIVESGRTEVVLDGPTDTYTQELLKNVPGERFTEITRSSRLNELSGDAMRT